VDPDTLSYVFISYSRRQQAYARRLAAYLGTGHGIAVWIDDELITGDRWENVIKARIDECAALIVVMSRDAEASEWVGREIARAQSKGKPVLPVLFDGEVFFRLSDIQFEDVRGGVLPGERFIAALRRATGIAADAPRVTTSQPVDSTREGTTGKRTVAWTVATILATGTLAGAVAIWITMSNDNRLPTEAQATSSSESRSVEHAPSTTPTTTTYRTQYRGEVRVYNNGTIAGLASRAASDLRQRGWYVAEVGVYPFDRISTSTVYYRQGTDEELAAQELAAEFRLRVEPRFEGMVDTIPGLIVIVTNDYSGPVGQG
jgi:TIR domain/LytR cell envelope-related transcriptional attenuator